jgi:hypothetical protein
LAIIKKTQQILKSQKPQTNFISFFRLYDPLSTKEDKIVEKEFRMTNAESQTTVEEIFN